MSKKPTTPAERQAKRRDSLNLAADLMGFESWTKFETAVIRGKIVLQAIPVDEAERISKIIDRGTADLSERSRMIWEATVHYMESDEHGCDGEDDCHECGTLPGELHDPQLIMLRSLMTPEQRELVDRIKKTEWVIEPDEKGANNES